MPKSANKNRCGRQVAKTIEFARSFAIVHFECAYDLMYYLVCILVFDKKNAAHFWLDEKS